jgi:hypothetical protein
MRCGARRLVLFSWVGWLVGCTGISPEPEVQTAEQAITNGALETGHPEVGVIYNGVQVTCTGTLIGRHTVLTAAHCVTDSSAPQTVLLPVSFYLDSLSGQRLQAVEVVVHSEYVGGNSSDLALVRLDTDLSFPPAQLSPRPPLAGESVLMIGFGKSGEPDDTFGTKRRAENVVGKVYAQSFSIFGSGGTNGNLCDGDSGGPTFAVRDNQEVLIGIHSTREGMCGQKGNDLRADAFLSWISTASRGDVAIASPSPGSDGPGQTTSGTGSVGAGRPFGAACEMASDCLSALCTGTPSAKICSKTCSAPSDCPSPLVCQDNICRETDRSTNASNGSASDVREGSPAAGCTVGGRLTPPPWWLLPLVILLARRRASRRPS